MKFAIIGCGSIGRRHASNFLKLGHEVVAWNRGSERRVDMARDFGIEVFDDLEVMLKTTGSDAAIICSPNIYHVGHALQVVEAGLHVFVEKPFSHTIDGISGLIEQAKRRNLVTHVGCNMRFHFGPQSVKKVIDSGRIGTVLRAGFVAAMHLPDWHPSEDYRKMYSSRKDLGGGAVLDFVHEIDLAVWMFGKPERVAAILGYTGAIEIETEDQVDILFGNSPVPSVNLHLDYLEKPFRRSIDVLGDLGWIRWDLSEGSVKVHDYNKDQTKTYYPPGGYEKNDMYLDQAIYFIDCITNGRSSMSDFQMGGEVMDVVHRIKHSSMASKFC